MINSLGMKCLFRVQRVRDEVRGIVFLGKKKKGHTRGDIAIQSFLFVSSSHHHLNDFLTNLVSGFFMELFLLTAEEVSRKSLV